MSCTDTGLVQGKNAIMQIYKGGQYRDFAVATDLTVEFKTDTKSVKTIGDGVWKRSRAQSIGYTISLNGLIKVGTFDDPIAFDLLNYQVQFTDLQYRIIYQEGSDLKVIQGNALVDSTQLAGPSDGFATATFNMVGNGQPLILDSLIPCNLTISSITTGTADTSAHTIPITINLTGTGTLYRIEYTVNGGNRYISYSTSFSVNYPYVLGQGSFVYVFYPICDNGFEGTSNTLTLNYYGGGGGGPV